MAEQEHIQTTRQRLMELVTDFVGYHPDEVKESSDAHLIALVLDTLVDKVEELDGHTHNIT